jgi:hypothetical protein
MLKAKGGRTMTEEEWLVCEDSRQMIRAVVRSQCSANRKLCLFALELCRRVLNRLPRPELLGATDYVERAIDGENVEMPRGLMHLARVDDAGPRFDMNLAKALDLASMGAHAGGPLGVAGGGAALALNVFNDDSANSPARPIPSDERARLALVCRDIFGNPFRPVAFSPSWRTDTAVAVARQMYDSREFGAMPILADALQDAGCDNEDILNHCRDANATHVRGCWVVDLVLGKE